MLIKRTTTDQAFRRSDNNGKKPRKSLTSGAVIKEQLSSTAENGLPPLFRDG